MVLMSSKKRDGRLEDSCMNLEQPSAGLSDVTRARVPSSCTHPSLLVGLCTSWSF